MGQKFRVLHILKRIGIAYLMLDLTMTLLLLPVLAGLSATYLVLIFSGIRSVPLAILVFSATTVLCYVPALRMAKASARILKRAITGKA